MVIILENIDIIDSNLPGVKKFKDYFENFSEQYVLIGGAACHLILENEGLEMRVTKDFDIILSVNALTKKFVNRFYEFIIDGGYNEKERSFEQGNLYRFINPENLEFPYQIEILTKEPNYIESEFSPGEITYIKAEEEYVSLSAILMNEDYCDFVIKNKISLNGLSVANPIGLILLKMKAWLNLNEEKENGNHVNSRDIKKHRTDVYRISQLLRVDDKNEIPKLISEDVNKFCLKVLEKDDDNVLENLGIGGSLEELIDDLKVTLL